MSLLLRDQLIRDCWVPSGFRQPETDPRGRHYPVQVWGTIDDPRLRLPGRPHSPFQDVVAWWPATRIWTVTLQCRADEDAVDFQVNVTFWQPLPPLPF